MAQLKVATTGNVNIGGSNNAWTKLQVVGNSTFTNTSGNITSSAYIRGLSTYSTPTTPDYTWFNSDQTGLFHPSVDEIGFSTVGTEIMRLKYNVGIGMTNGTARLNVYGNSTATAFSTAVYHTSDNLFASISQVNRQSSKSWGVVYNSTDRFYVTGLGYVYAYSYNNLSDASCKENVKTIPSALDKVNQLRGVLFNFKKESIINSKDTSIYLPEKPQKTEIGFIAQEVELVIPEVVSTLPDGKKTVAYGNIVALLVEAIKEQDIKIAKLQSDLTTCCDLKLSDQEGNKDHSITSLNTENSRKAILFQNNPNPFVNETQIKCYIPANVILSELYIYNMQGLQIKKIEISGKETQIINIQGSVLSPGMYMYSLIVDGKEIDTKKMILTN